ncbi:MAG: class I SAM-dependent methyltransferase [Candidatus Riflebacteria bacterium]|nr:class I SAM-dependent methyltransferase [Candidatus Riflebacteria bacterium]
MNGSIESINDEEKASVVASAALDPLAMFLSDPESHLSDILYIYFRIYKKRVLWGLMERILAGMHLTGKEHLHIADIGASMGFDALFLMRKWTENFRRPLPCANVELTLIEGDRALIERGKGHLKSAFPPDIISHKYIHQPLEVKFELESGSQDIAICSEVLEHMENPGQILEEIHRILRPGGYLMVTTDNSPSFLNYIRRIPSFLQGQYSKRYARPQKEAETVGTYTWKEKEYRIYGHINLNSTSFWERLCKKQGFDLVSYGTYESVRRGGGGTNPLVIAMYFVVGAIVSMLPRSLGRYFGDTTALLLQKPRKS